MLETYTSFFFTVLKYFMLTLTSGLGTVIFAFLLWVVMAAGWWIVSLFFKSIEQHESFAEKIFLKIAVIVAAPLFFVIWGTLNGMNDNRERAEQWEKGWESTGIKVEPFKLLEVNPPKHFYVTIKHVATGTLYEHQYVSKHCNSWKSNTLGDNYNIQYETFRHRVSGQTKIRFINLYGVFCES